MRLWFGEAAVEHGEFMRWLSGIGKLSLAQRRQALEASTEAAGVAEGVGSGSGGSAQMGKNLPNYLGWRRALEAWGDQASPQNWILGAIGMGPYQQ